MNESTSEFKSSIGVKWFKSESGSTWLCRADALEGISNPTEEELSNACVSESDNPQNN